MKKAGKTHGYLMLKTSFIILNVKCRIFVRDTCFYQILFWGGQFQALFHEYILLSVCFYADDSALFDED